MIAAALHHSWALRLHSFRNDSLRAFETSHQHFNNGIKYQVLASRTHSQEVQQYHTRKASSGLGQMG